MSIISEDVVKLIEEYIGKSCANGEVVTLQQVGEYLSKHFDHDSPSTFKIIAQVAFQHNQLPGFYLKRGVKGGVYPKDK